MLNNEKPFDYRPKVCSTYKIIPKYIKILNDMNIDLILVDDSFTNEEFHESLKGCHGIILSSNFKINSAALDSAGSQLKIIATLTSGVDHIDIKECLTRNVIVANLPSVYNDSVAEYTIGLLIIASRKIILATKLAPLIPWNKIDEDKLAVGKRLKGSIVGVFGLGALGTAVTKKLSGFEVKKVIYHNRNVREEAAKLNYEYVSFDELLQQSDFLICTCSANKDNLDKFNLDAFKKMKPDSIFINVARGHIVNHDDLYQALSTNIIGAAALDVTKPEPLPSDHGLYTLQNCIITPHVSWADKISTEENYYLCVSNLINGLKGKEITNQIR